MIILVYSINIYIKNTLNKKIIDAYITLNDS